MHSHPLTLIPLVLAVALSILAGCDSGTSVVEPPNTPALRQPVDGSEQMNALEFRWTEVPGATQYHFQFTDDGDFAAVGLDAKQVDAPLVSLNELAIGKTYYWRVRALNGEVVGEWSSPWRFEVTSEAPKPGETKLVWPPDEAPHIPRTLRLRWEAATGAEMYHVQVSQEPVFYRLDADLHSVVGESQEVWNLDSTYVYFWRVRSRNIAGYGPWSPTWSFIVEAAEGWVPGT